MERLLRRKIEKYGSMLANKVLDLECQILIDDFKSDLMTKKKNMELEVYESILEDYLEFFKDLEDEY
jgi:hypothetical protein